jgi:uncharacterized membrane protein
MAEGRAYQAIARIEQALGRIEAAAARPAADTETLDELARLRDAHAALRGRVEGAIGRIDDLIEGAA